VINIAIVGFGVMGRIHLQRYQSLKNVNIVAICDCNMDELGNTDRVQSDLISPLPAPKLTGIKLYADFDCMLAESDLDAVSITTPTYLHAELTIKSLQAGINVLCEKPMGLNRQQCDEMLAASEKSGKVLQIAHCIRFWPEYSKAKQIIDSGEYGEVKAASFRRLSVLPTWSWKNWFLNDKKSGSMVLDLHIHDSDFIQYLFGLPKAVRSFGAKGSRGSYEHILTSYIYNHEKVVSAEASWMMTSSFDFEMSFYIVLEKATLVFAGAGLKICPIEGETFLSEIATGDGYLHEIEYFLKTIAGEDIPEVITPAQSMNTMVIIEAEIESLESGLEVNLNG
jgi:1,5-anhydro-D-fructose reductase (1,5-anhydro-D-mannitol-forming)